MGFRKCSKNFGRTQFYFKPVKAARMSIVPLSFFCVFFPFVRSTFGAFVSVQMFSEFLVYTPNSSSALPLPVTTFFFLLDCDAGLLDACRFREPLARLGCHGLIEDVSVSRDCSGAHVARGALLPAKEIDPCWASRLKHANDNPPFSRMALSVDLISTSFCFA